MAGGRRLRTGARAQRPNEAKEAMARGALLKQTVAASYVGAHGKKYTDEALAQEAGVSVNTIRNLWKGQNAELSTLLGVATASGMSKIGRASCRERGERS